MEAIVAFFEKLVGDSTWRRVVLILAILGVLVIGLWGYEYFTGRSRIARMEFAVEHLKKLSDPELRKNVQGDPKGL